MKKLIIILAGMSINFSASAAAWECMSACMFNNFSRIVVGHGTSMNAAYEQMSDSCKEFVDAVKAEYPDILNTDEETYLPSNPSDVCFKNPL